MELDKFISLLATIFGTLGAIYVMLGILSMSPELMERQTVTYIDFSVPQIESIAKHKADSIAGFIFIISAFVLTLVNIIFVPHNIEVFKSKTIALALSAILVGGVYATLYFVSLGIYKNQKMAISKIITSRYIDSIFEKGSISSSDARSLTVYAKELLGLSISEGQTTEEFFLRICNLANKEIPKNFDFSKVKP